MCKYSQHLVNEAGGIQFGDAMVAMTMKVCPRFDFIVHDCDVLEITRRMQSIVLIVSCPHCTSRM